MKDSTTKALLRHRPTRQVITRSGTTFIVPAGISRNHGAGCWVVTFGTRDWKPTSFRSGGEKQSLDRAKAELVRRMRACREHGHVAHVDRTERTNKTRYFGRPGVRFASRSHHCGYFTSSAIHKNVKKTLNFRVDYDHPRFRECLEQQWRLAIVAKDVMLEMLVACQWKRVSALRSKSVPEDWRVRASLLDLDPAAVDELANQLLKKRDEL